MSTLAALLALAVIVGAACGLVLMLRWQKLQDRLAQMERELARINSYLERGQEPMAPANAVPPANAEPRANAEPPARPVTPEAPGPLAAGGVPAAVSPLARLLARLQQNWMIWLGGGCVALAGIFLAKYSLEQGLLNAAARVGLGVATGTVLLVVAEVLRRRTGEAHQAFAALAGGGSITLFAAFVASFHLYQMFSPSLTFALLVVVALVTMVLAYVHGPVLAAIGILGAYLVPALVSTGSGNLPFALAYSLVISASALLLLRYVYRVWLWWGFLACALVWWLLSLDYANADGLRGWYLAALGYLMLAVPNLDWRLARSVPLAAENYKLLLWPQRGRAAEQQNLPGLLLLMAAQFLAMRTDAGLADFLLLWSPLVLLVLLAARTRETLALLPWLMLLVQVLGLVATRLVVLDDRVLLAPLAEGEQASLFLLLSVYAVVFTGFALFYAANNRFKALWLALATLAPLLLLGTAYLLSARTLVAWQWGVLTGLVALVYLGLATHAVRRASLESLPVWLFIGGHFAAALAAVMVLEAASLTLVLAAQVVSVSWVIRHFNLPALGWLLKLLVALVVLRLTLNPWLADYPAGVHWSLWTFGGSTLCCVLATRLLRDLPNLSRWAEAAALHLLVLTLWAEVRYWLYDGMVFARDYSLLEAGLYVALFGSLSLVYYRRSLVSHNLQKIYVVFAMILLGLALANYGVVLVATAVSLHWVWAAISTTPLANLMLLVFGAPVVLAVLSTRLHHPGLRRPATLFAGVTLFVFVSLQIRHLWQGTINLNPATADGELYTYSVVWLLMAMLAILGGTWRFGQSCYRAGMLLLALVIAKLFFIDLAGLEGLWRVASFMGLGVSLLGISYLHQRLQSLRLGTGGADA